MPTTTRRVFTTGRPIARVLLLMLLAAGAASGQTEGDATEGRAEGQQRQQQNGLGNRHCGRDLVETINMVCAIYGGTYSPIATSKRAATRNIFRTWAVKRQQEGIVEECCYRACNIRTMRRYCTSPFGNNGRMATNQEVTSATTTTRPTTSATAAPTTTTTSPASPQGTIYQLTTTTHDLIPIPNDDYFPMVYYRSNRAYEQDSY